ncbi:hypothetical protein GCM10008938_52000 [Deinococcus roseus]|uniref:Transposase n=1 Tax=Deinococcus roseus TaxID=392414 RepID=A0ABQ2DKM5_9DEIO|nr:hypothetical protein GCM10008938_52000 [Deinococcus roseus]
MKPQWLTCAASTAFTSAQAPFWVPFCPRQATFYRWKQKYTGTTPDQKRLKENEKLLKMVGKLQMENDAMKTVIRKKY